MSPGPLFTPTLAQIPSGTLDQVGWFVVGLAMLLLMAERSVALWQRTRRRPRIEEEFATKSELVRIENAAAVNATTAASALVTLRADVKADIDAAIKPLDEKIDGMESRMKSLDAEIKSANRSCEARTSGVHNRTNDLLGEVREMVGQVKLITPWILKQRRGGHADETAHD